MADLIDRDKVLETVFNVMSYDKVIHKHRALNRNIKQIPKADTERHAHWIDITKCEYHKTSSEFMCSNCYKSIEFAEPISSPFDYDETGYCYCGKCGCRMDDYKE